MGEHIERGLALRSGSDLPGAEAAFRAALQAGEHGAGFNLGSVLIERGELQAAIDVLGPDAAAGQGDSAALLGLAYEDSGDLARAITAYRAGADNGSASAAYNLGVLLGGRGDKAAANEAYRQADGLGSQRAAFNLGVDAAERGDDETAEAFYRRAEERGSVDAALNLGLLHFARGDEEEAEAAFERAAAQGSDEARHNLDLIRGRDTLPAVARPEPEVKAPPVGDAEKRYLLAWAENVFARADVGGGPRLEREIANRLAGLIIAGPIADYAESRGSQDFIDWLGDQSPANALDQIDDVVMRAAVAAAAVNGTDLAAHVAAIKELITESKDEQFLPWAAGVREEFGTIPSSSSSSGCLVVLVAAISIALATGAGALDRIS